MQTVYKYTFVFSTRLNEKNYCICLHLFGTIVAEKTTHVNLGREIKVTLFKAHKCKMIIHLPSLISFTYGFTYALLNSVGTAWLRLQLENEKNPLITSDPDYLSKDKWFMPLKIGNYITI